jgi:hypothetical protein
MGGEAGEKASYRCGLPRSVTGLDARRSAVITATS